jgi:hypothetical protein
LTHSTDLAAWNFEPHEADLIRWRTTNQVHARRAGIEPESVKAGDGHGRSDQSDSFIALLSEYLII